MSELEAPITINIGNICEGAVIEAFDIELAKVLKNIIDPNTEAKAKRRITLTVEFAPKEDRTQVMTNFSCDTKLAGLIPATSRMYIGKDAESTLYALKEDPRQMHIFAPPKAAEAPTVIEFGVSRG